MHYGTTSQYGDIKKSLRWFGGERKAYMKIQMEKERRKGVRKEGGKKKRGRRESPEEELKV